MPASLPLPTLLSQVLVAHTIELDNEAERRMPHTTTREDDPEARRGAPWLVSYPLWANVLRYVGPEGTRVCDIAAQARTSRLQLGGLRRWGYVRLTGPPGGVLNHPPQDDAVVHLTRHGRAGQQVWATMPEVMDQRWRSRFSGSAVDELQHSLHAIDESLDIDPPDYLPLVYPTQNGRSESPTPRFGPESATRAAKEPDLSALLSGVLFAFTRDFEAESKISLPISANTLRVLDTDGVRIRDLPRMTGVSKEANAMCAGWLRRRECAEQAPDPNASRGQVLRLTAKGRAAQAKYRRMLAETEDSWRSTHGAAAIDNLRRALEPLVGDGTLASSPLAAGLEPQPDNWRATVRRPETLPHYPTVLHRGAYPDGS
jgi:DNA-binding MarR family transcriptional regulator